MKHLQALIFGGKIDWNELQIDWLVSVMIEEWSKVISSINTKDHSCNKHNTDVTLNDVIVHMRRFGRFGIICTI